MPTTARAALRSLSLPTLALLLAVSGSGPLPAPAAAEEPAGAPSIKAIMGKLAKGPNSLTPTIGKELQQEPPPWATIRTQTKEFAELAAALGKQKPPMGAADSWAQLTASYSARASELDAAAQAGDRDKALAAHEFLSKSCMACHREHKPKAPGAR